MRSTVGALAVAVLITSLLLVARQSEASIIGSLMDTFSSVFTKARNLRERASYEPYIHRQMRLDGRSNLGPVDRQTGVILPEVASFKQDGDFMSKCIFSRGPNFRETPKAYFYSTKNHSSDTLGCDPDSANKVVLETIDGHFGFYPQLNKSAIKKQLVDSGDYDTQVPTYFIVHGFLADWKSTWMCSLKDLVLNTTSANVFVVDWSGGSKPLLPIDYSSAVGNTQYVGALLGKLVNILIELTEQKDASSFQMIGHSLGAHISGFTGYYVQNMGRIIGLDPAGPCFRSADDDGKELAGESGRLSHGKRRLSPESAKLVVALHTDAALFGLNENCAHFDVYVNGGYRQPECGASSLKQRFEDLVTLNLGDAFDINIACSHSYSHKLVRQIIENMSLLGTKLFTTKQQIRHETSFNRKLLANNGRGIATGDEVLDKCYQIAYKCPSWELFKKGECGYCFDNEPRCIFTGLSVFQAMPAQASETEVLPDELQMKEGEDDGAFNDEEDPEEEKVEEEASEKPEGALAATLGPAKHNSRGHHFLRTGSGADVCLYQYQIVVAVYRSWMEREKNTHYFYLHIPLTESGMLHDDEGNWLHNRLVQVSHKLDPKSHVYERFRDVYLNSLRDKVIDLDVDLSDDLDFYTALITFTPAPEEKCKNNSVVGVVAKDKWQLCRPPRNIQEAHLWSSSKEQVEAVVWVGMNYMSSATYDARLSGSYMMSRTQDSKIQTREEMLEYDRADLEGLGPKKSYAFGDLTKSAIKSAGCFLSAFGPANSKRDFKCKRSDRELKYAIKLKPTRLGYL